MPEPYKTAGSRGPQPSEQWILFMYVQVPVSFSLGTSLRPKYVDLDLAWFHGTTGHHEILPGEDSGILLDIDRISDVNTWAFQVDQDLP